eukprot:15440032-Alexandrium_andersonii.AAC.2
MPVEPRYQLGFSLPATHSLISRPLIGTLIAPSVIPRDDAAGNVFTCRMPFHLADGLGITSTVTHELVGGSPQVAVDTQPPRLGLQVNALLDRPKSVDGRGTVGRNVNSGIDTQGKDDSRSFGPGRARGLASDLTIHSLATIARAVMEKLHALIIPHLTVRLRDPHSSSSKRTRRHGRAGNGTVREDPPLPPLRLANPRHVALPFPALDHAVNELNRRELGPNTIMLMLLTQTLQTLLELLRHVLPHRAKMHITGLARTTPPHGAALPPDKPRGHATSGQDGRQGVWIGPAPAGPCLLSQRLEGWASPPHVQCVLALGTTVRAHLALHPLDMPHSIRGPHASYLRPPHKGRSLGSDIGGGTFGKPPVNDATPCNAVP